MTISGETIDYGPCAFVEAHDPKAVFSSIDSQGRYAFGNQPGIARWNLARLAETLLPLVDADSERAVALVTEVLEAFPARYQHHWLAGMRAKLGLASAQPDDLALVTDFLALLQAQALDFTLAFRGLAEPTDAPGYTRSLCLDVLAFDAWAARWHKRLAQESSSHASRALAMRQANPAYIPRNHRVEEALAAAVEHADYAPFEQLLAVLTQPFDTQAHWTAYAQPAPAAEQQGYRTFCGT